MTMRLKDFEALGKALQAREREAAKLRARRQAAEAATRAEQVRQQRLRDEFAIAVGRVQSLAPDGRANIRRALPSPEPRQSQLDEQAALKEALSDEVDVESLLLTDDGLSFRRPGIGPDVVSKLRRGHWAIQSQIDLHGLRRDEARESLAGFVRESTRRGERCLRVVHGKGHGSPGRQPVLKARVQRWLAQCAEVIAFAQAPGAQGGAGALIVLLAGSTQRI